jgi:hypothetical protein
MAPLLTRVEDLRNDRIAQADLQQLVADLRAAEANEPLAPRAAAEFADVFALIGRRQVAAADAAARAEGAAWLQRAVEATPEHPDRHFWPGVPTTWGFPQQEAVDEARRLLRAQAATPK